MSTVVIELRQTAEFTKTIRIPVARKPETPSDWAELRYEAEDEFACADIEDLNPEWGSIQLVSRSYEEE